MKSSSAYSLTRREIFFLSVVVVVSFIIFLYYLQQNSSTFYYDENRYLAFSNRILTNGLFTLHDEITTYFYPLVMSFIRIFSSIDNHQVFKIALSFIQFIVYVITICWIARETWRQSGNKLTTVPILILGLWNPYLIQATTLVLTDLLSSCFWIIAIYITLLFDLNQPKSWLFSLGAAFANVMIRPANLILLPIIGTIILFRFMRQEFSFRVKNLLLCLVLVGIFLPQLVNNIHYFGKVTPLVASDLYGFQQTLATKYLKYGTVVIPEEKAPLYFYSPQAPNAEINMVSLLRKQPFTFFYTYFIHLFSVIDWGYVDTYINDYYPLSRIIGSIWLYITWFTVICGSWYFIVNGISKVLKERMVQMKGFQRIYCRSWQDVKVVAVRSIKRTGEYFNRIPSHVSFYGSILFAAVLYTAFIGTTTPEARFGYPILMLLLPFSGVGLCKWREWVTVNKSSRILRGLAVLILSLGLIFILFQASFELDKTTERIFWKSHIKHQIYEIRDHFLVNN